MSSVDRSSFTFKKSFISVICELLWLNFQHNSERRWWQRPPFLVSGGSLRSSPTVGAVSCGFSRVAFVVLRCFSPLPSLPRVFIMSVEFHQMLSLRHFRWSCGFSLHFINVVYPPHSVVCLNHCVELSLHSGTNPSWSCCIILLISGGIQFVGILLGIFASMFITDIGPHFSFIVVSLSGFGSIEWIRKCSLLFCKKILRRIGVNSPLSVW